MNEQEQGAVAQVEQLFPLKKGYTGPNVGLFTFLHHEKPLELSQNVQERVAYVLRGKDEHEQQLRANAMRYLKPDELPGSLGTTYKLWLDARGHYDDLAKDLDNAGSEEDKNRIEKDLSQAVNARYEAKGALERAIEEYRDLGAAFLVANHFLRLPVVDIDAGDAIRLGEWNWAYLQFSGQVPNQWPADMLFQGDK